MDFENDVRFSAVDPSINDSVVSSTINYYGHGLLKQLVDTKPQLLPLTAMKDINYHSFKARSDKLKDQQEVRLYTTAVDFILKNAVHLFSQPSRSRKTEADGSKYGYIDKYKFMPPIEYYLQANKKTRLQQFYKDLHRGDILICRANQAMRSQPVQSLKVVARDAGPHQLLVKALSVNVNLDLSKTRVPKIDESSIPNTWLANTLLKVEVLSVVNDTSTDMADIMVGTLGETFQVNNTLEIVLGKIGHTDVPDIITAVESYTRDSVGSFSASLQKLESFKNRRSVQHIASQMGLSMKNCSLMPTLRSEFPLTLQYRQLRRLQLSRWAHKHVADGVAHFKRGLHTEAFQLLNKALSIDSENVEAYVAKGALLANMGSFEKAVEDFESALKFNPSHGNARKYICETLHELGKRHEEDGKLGLAESCYLRSLQVNPEHKGCLFAVTKLHGRTGFASTITKKIMAGMEEENEDEAQVLSLKMDNKKKSTEEEEVEIIESSNEDVKKLRPKSLSPFAQKMALQNNAWKPPSYIQTTDTYLNQKDSLELVTFKKNETISPFVIGRKKNSVSDSQNTIYESNTSVSNTVQPSAAASTSTIPSSVCAVISSLVESVSSTMSASGESCHVTSGQPVVYPSCSSTAVVVPANSSSTLMPDASGQLKDTKSELDRNFENMLVLKPQTKQDVEALSMLLLVLSKRYKAQNNYVRAKLCLDKSLKHNPNHAATLKALEELLKISKPLVVEADSVDEPAMPITAHYQMGTRIKQQPPSVYSAFSEHLPPAFMQEYRPTGPTVDEHQLLQYPAYARPAEPADYTYSNIYSLPSAVVMNAPLQMQLPSVPGETPKRGHWGTDYLRSDHTRDFEPETENQSKSFQSQEDKDYFDRVNSFLNKIMLRDPSTSSGKVASSSKTRRYSPQRSRSRSISRDRRSDSRSKFQERRSRSRSKIRSKRSISWSSSPRSRIDHSRSRDSLPEPHVNLAKPNESLKRRGNEVKRSLSREAGSKSTSCSNSPLSQGRLYKEKHADTYQKVSNKQHPRKRSKVVKKRRRSRTSSYSSSSSSSSRSSRGSSGSSTYSSSSYSSSRSRSSGRSSRRSKNKKKRRHSQRDRKGKLKIGIEDDPLLQGLDKDILKKLTEKLQANSLLLDSKESKKRKKKKKKKDEKVSDLHKKKNRAKYEKKGTGKVVIEETTVAKKKEKLSLDMKENNENKEAVNVETNLNIEKKIKEEKNIENGTSGSNENNDKSIKATKDKNAKAPPAIKEMLIKSKKKAALSKVNLGEEGKSVEKVFKELDIEKAAQNDTLLDIKALMQLPGLEDLKLKLKNYYTMCGETQSDLGAKKLVGKQPSRSVLPEKSVEPVLTDKPSCVVTVPKKKETSTMNVSVVPDLLDVRKDAPVQPELSKSGFKSTFTPVMPSKVLEPVRPSFESILRMDCDILTPKEFRSGLKELKDRQFQELVSKAQSVANHINRSADLEESRTSKKRRSFSRSRSTSRGRRSKSKSRSRRSRSRSRSRKPRLHDRRSRSRSSDCRLRRRNRSRSGSGSPQYRNRSRYTFVREGYFRGQSSYQQYRGTPGNRSFGWSSQESRPRWDGDRRRQRTRSHSRSLSKSRSKVRSASRSSSRSYSPRRSEFRPRSYSPRQPPPKPSTSSKPGVSKEKGDSDNMKKSAKTAMFGKWVKSEQNDDNEEVADPGKALDEMESFLMEAKKKKMEEMKDRNKVFLKNSVN